MNPITLKGQVSKIYVGNKNTIVTLFVRGRRINFPQVIFTGKNRDLIDGFAEGDFVTVSGSLKTRGIRQENGRILHTQFIRGEEIVLADEPEDGKFQYENEAIINGEIVRAEASNNMITLLVRLDGEKFNVWVFNYIENAEDMLSEYPVGSVISAKCEIQTVRKEIRGEVKFFENVVVKDIITR